MIRCKRTERPSRRTNSSRPTIPSRRFVSKSASRSVEIEAKFPFQKADVDRIAAVGRLKGTKSFTDEYWDHRTRFTLTTRDMWLRQRDQLWELKVPLSTWRREEHLQHHLEKSFIDQYKELEGEQDIKSFLVERALVSQPSAPRASLPALLASNDFAVFCRITTQRLTFECDGVSVTFDTATPLGYSVGELEIMTDETLDVAAAEEKIKSFAKRHALNINSRMPGKVLEHIRRNNAQHWQALKESGHLKSKNVHEY